MQFGWTTLTGNLAMSSLMAAVLGLAGCLPVVRYKPRLRYALWLLVLLKLAPLPGLYVPVALMPTLESASRTSEAGLLPVSNVESHGRQAVDHVGLSGTTSLSGSEAISGSDHRQDSRLSEAQIGVSILLLLATTTTAVLIFRSLSQMRRVARLIACAAHADERIIRLAIESARLMDFRKIPEIRVVNARITPLLWMGRGRPTIVLPVGLIERLDDDQIRCIFCHELAHHLRRDPWVNLLAYLGAAAYWWNPVAWWARRELLSAQEECCDALAILRTGISRRKYAEALFETIEFIHDERPLSPMLANGFGRTYFTRRRFEMIAESTMNRRVFGLIVPLVVALGIAFVSLPVRGQAAKDEKEDLDILEAAKIARQIELEAVKINRQIENDLNAITARKRASTSAPELNRTSLDFNKTAEVKVDPKRHCLYVGMAPYDGCENGSLRIDLEKGVTYTVRCSGEAFMSSETGEFADPYPGVFFGYQTDEQDCHAVRNTILKPGDSITFTTPTCIGDDESTFVIAFFMQAWKHRNAPAQRGSYTLTFTRSAQD